MIVIGLQGVKRSGKDTFAAMLIKHLEALDKSVYRTAFANPLKMMLTSMSGVDFFSDEDKEKDQVFTLDMSTFKEFTGLHLDVSVFYLLDHFARLDGFSTLHLYSSKRKLMQFFGTDICRKYKGELYWVNKLDTPTDVDVVLVTDVRFQSEVDKIKSLGGIIVEIKNPLAVALDTHASESLVNKADFEIDNNATLDHLNLSAFNFVHRNLVGM